MGFQRSSIRRIAADAGVDPALVHHYYGNKKELFLAAVEAPFDPSQIIPDVVAGGLEGLGERLVTGFVNVWDSPLGVRAVAFIRSAVADPHSAPLMEEFILTQVVSTALREVDATVDSPQLRGSLIASQLLGLATTRYLFRLSPLTSLSAAQLAKIYGPTIQRYLTMDLAQLHDVTAHA